MATATLKNGVSSRHLLEAAGQLRSRELDHFVKEVISLRARRVAPCLSPTESELLKRINQKLPASVGRRMRSLARKSQEESLTAKEHREYLKLAERSEWLTVERVKAMAELAKVRKTTLANVMRQLGIRAASNG